MSKRARLSLLCLIAATLWQASISDALAQKFRCENARGPTQQAICGNPELLALHQELEEAFEQVQSRHRDQPAVRWRQANEQDKFVFSGRNRCDGNVDCLTRAYQRRLGQIRESGGLPPRVPQYSDEGRRRGPTPSAGAPGSRQETAPVAHGPVAPRAPDAPFSLAGLWEGSYNCQGNRLMVSLTVPPFGDKGELTLDFYPPPGKTGDFDGARSYRFQLDTLLGEVKMQAGRLVGDGARGRPLDAEFVGFVSPDGLTVSGTANLRARECGKFSFARVASLQQREAARTAPPPTQRAGPVTPMLAARSHEEFCATLKAWGDQFRVAHPTFRQPFMMADRTQKENLLRDEFFTTFIGKPYADLTREDRFALQRLMYSGQRGNPGCPRDAEGEYYSLLTVPPVSLNVIQEALTVRRQLEQAIERLPAGRDSVARLNALVGESEKRLAALWPSDRTAFNAIVARKRASLAEATLVATLKDAPNAPATLELISDLHFLSTNAGASGAQKARPVLEQKIGAYAATALATHPPVRDIVSFAEAAVKQKELRAALQPYMDYEAAKRAVGETRDRFLKDSSAVSQSLRVDLASPAQASTFYPYRSALNKLVGASADEAIVRDLVTAYQAAADSWIGAQVAAHKSTPKPESDGAPPKFDPNNPLGTGTPTALSSADEQFLALPWAFKELIRAAYVNDRQWLYDTGAYANIRAFTILGGHVRQVCPALVTREFRDLALKEAGGIDPYTLNPERFLKWTMETFNGMAQRAGDPAMWLGQMRSAEEFGEKVRNDAGLMIAIVNQTSCDDPRPKRMFDNMLAFVRDPTAGIKPESLKTVDVCVVDSNTSGNSFRAQEWCECAGPILDRELTSVQKAFARIKVGGNLHSLMVMYPHLGASVSRCRRL